MKLDENTRPGEVVAARRVKDTRRASGAVVVGAMPAVSLLPREFETAARARVVRNALVGGFLAAVLAAVGATAIAGAAATAATDRLASATTRTQVLNGQIAKFRDVQQLQNDIAVGTAAVAVGTSTEIDWKSQLDAVQAVMPAGFTIESVQGDSATAIEAYAQGTTPLDLPRAASLDIAAKGDDARAVPAWLREIRSIPAYADMTAAVSTTDGETKVEITLHLSAKALISSTGKNR